jgi:hypothetical protein
MFHYFVAVCSISSQANTTTRLKPVTVKTQKLGQQHDFQLASTLNASRGRTRWNVEWSLAMLWASVRRRLFVACAFGLRYDARGVTDEEECYLYHGEQDKTTEETPFRDC